MKICNTFGIDLIYYESEMCLLHVQVDLCHDGCVCLPVDFLAGWKPSDEIGADNLLGSLRYGNWEYSQFRVRDQLEALILLTALDVLVDESAYEWPPIVMLD